MVNKMNKAFYNTILSQTFSVCGNYLVVGDIYGCISVFFLTKALDPTTNLTKEELHPKYTFTVRENIQINSLITTKSYLLVGLVGEIVAYTWKNLKINKLTSTWSIEIPNMKNNFDKGDINSMLFDELNGLLYVACDNDIYVHNIENRQIIRILKGHEDYLHALSWRNEEIVSGGEDGSILVWDPRKNNYIHKLQPYLNPKISRNDLGKWIGALDANEDWLLCGGGPRLSLWHWRTLNTSTIFPIEDKGIHVTEIYKDKIFAGGRTSNFYQLNFNGMMTNEIPTSCVTTYSCVHQELPYQILCLAGSSPKIDVCNNFIYKNLQLSLY